MPAFGYMLLLNDRVHEYLTILNYPSVWRVWFLYYGSFFLAAGTIAFSLFCSNDIKRYVSPYELADAQTQHLYRLNLRSQTLSKVKSMYDKMSPRERSLLGLDPFDFSDQPITPEGTQLRQLSVALIHIWAIQNIKRPILRMGLSIVFGFGLALVAIPAVITFGQVTVLFLKRLTS